MFDICVDVGNTFVKIAIFKGDDLVKRISFKTDSNMVEEEFEAIILAQLNNTNFADEDNVAIYSSVVPGIDFELCSAIKNIFKASIKTLGPGLKTGLVLKVDNPNEVGADLIADLVAAKEIYKGPLLVIDLGTATKILLLDDKIQFSSAVIMPGLSISAEYLSQKAALLPSIGYKDPKPLLQCRNTIETMTAGTMYGHAHMVQGFINQYEKELGYKPKVILTGGSSKYIYKYIDYDIQDLDLSVKGLKIILNRNK